MSKLTRVILNIKREIVLAILTWQHMQEIFPPVLKLTMLVSAMHFTV